MNLILNQISVPTCIPQLQPSLKKIQLNLIPDQCCQTPNSLQVPFKFSKNPNILMTPKQSQQFFKPDPNLNPIPNLNPSSKFNSNFHYNPALNPNLNSNTVPTQL